MSQFLRNRAINRLIRTTTTSRSRSVTETLHHQHHHLDLITPREHRQHHSRNIHTTAYLRGAITARGASHRHLPSNAGGQWENQHHPTPAIPTRSITTNTTIISTPSTRTMATSTTAGSPKENRNPALPSSTPPSPRSAQEGQDATPCPAANESRPQPDNTAQEHQQPEAQGQQPAQSQSHPQALPAPPPKESDAAAAGDTTKLEVGGEGVRLDHLGPLVVHQDGTVSRISNWAEMTDIERKNTLRILGKRNQLRLDTLRGKAGDNASGSGDGQQQQAP